MACSFRLVAGRMVKVGMVMGVGMLGGCCYSYGYVDCDPCPPPPVYYAPCPAPVVVVPRYCPPPRVIYVEPRCGPRW